MTNDRAMQLIREAYENNITELDLSNNQLTHLSSEIGKLKNLVKLNLANTKLTQLPQEVTNLINLTELDLSNNQLTHLSSEIGKLKNLVKLNLANTQLTQLPQEVTYLINLKELDLSNNPITSPPPEIVLLGVEAIFTYLKQPKTIENNEAKLILVGNREVGKTCLAHRLIKDEFLEDTKIIEGIRISKWTIPALDVQSSEIKLNIWDFGRDEIYHATHQFFLTERSVYLLVWNARKKKDYDNIYYWLQTIEAFGGDSPIILTMSKMNESDDDLNLRDLKSQFPNTIAGYQKIDSKDGKGIPILKETIRETASRLPLMKVPWVDSWYRVREKLEGFKDYWITYDDFYKICVSEGLDEENINTLDGYLHELGVTLHFKDRLTLKNIVILKPQWATEAFYKILSTQSVIDNKGVLIQSELSKIWDMNTYPTTVYPQLMDLMNKFELAYELPYKKSYLVPELLPTEAPDFVWDNKHNLCFYYRYDYFLPPSIITRFIVRMHHNIEKNGNGMLLSWRGGAVLNLQNSRALVKMKHDEKEIEIRIKGDNKRGALGAICDQFDHINASIKKINVSKQIPCNCSENCPTRYPYEKLLKAETNNFEILSCLNSLKHISVSLLLDGYKKKEEMSNKNSEISNEQLKNQITVNNIITVDPLIKIDPRIDINVNVDLKVNLELIKNDLDNLNKEIKNLNSGLKNELGDIQDGFDKLGENTDKDKLEITLDKLYKFLKKLGDPNSDYNKVIKGTHKGIELAKKVIDGYNKVAPMLGILSISGML